MIQTLRIQVSRLFGILMAVMLCISTSGWEEQAPLMAAGLFFLGTILVGLATVGRLWCSLYIAGYKTKHLVTVGPYSMSRNPFISSLFWAPWVLDWRPGRFSFPWCS